MWSAAKGYLKVTRNVTNWTRATAARESVTFDHKLIFAADGLAGNGLDLKKAKRLITARENSIRAVKVSLQKAKEKQDEHMGEVAPASTDAA